uniref:PNPLA domain-containing protein n=1 Tax=Pristionchus pacificus TaxID=54126 RepID=A0A2A6BGP7_PRIPA
MNMREAVDKSGNSSRRRKRDRLKDFAARCKKMVAIAPPKKVEVVESSSSAPPSSNGAECESNEKTAIDGPTTPELEQKMDCRPPICLIPLKQHSDLGLSLSGCGFLSVYHFGVVNGASAGSLVSAMLVLAPDQLERSMEVMCEMADELNSLKFGALSPGFFLGERLVKIVDEFLPQDITKANHRLFISLTQHKTRENRLVSVYPTREYLITSLNASCYIPMYSMGLTAPPPELDGQGYIDGGYTNNLPDYSDLRTITVSPFCSKCDISPPDDAGFDWKMTLGNQHMKVNLRNIVRGAQALFPPSRATLKQYHDQHPALAASVMLRLICGRIGRMLASLFALLQRAICFGKKRDNIGELPFHVKSAAAARLSEDRVPLMGSDDEPTFAAHPMAAAAAAYAPAGDSWSEPNWDQQVIVESKIEEFRRKKAGEKTPPPPEEQIDFFSDMAPKLTKPKVLRPVAVRPQPQQRNVFEYSETAVLPGEARQQKREERLAQHARRAEERRAARLGSTKYQPVVN